MVKYVGFFEEENFSDIVLSMKSSDVPVMIEAYRKISDLYDYPLHLGVTEAGNVFSGTIKSAVGLGILLNEGIGDTVRVSLTGDVTKEIKAGRTILRSLGYSINGINLISCPTCGRTRVDLEKLVDRLEAEFDKIKINKCINVAVMGCAVNGPGEAKEADIGIAGGIGEYLLFKKGVIVRKVPEAGIFDALLEEIKEIAEK
jgi:(E)-4-hydroxy-3-methylbut-2-enyl-diphosphate synthase